MVPPLSNITVSHLNIIEYEFYNKEKYYKQTEGIFSLILVKIAEPINC